MESSNRQIWLNFLSLLPGTTLTLLTISVAFLRFYDERDFSILELINEPRVWSNRLTVAALVVALVNFGFEWDRRNRETNRLAAEEQRRAAEKQRRDEEEQRRDEEEQRRDEERERAARRARIQNRWIVLQIRHQLAPSEQTRAALTDFASFLQEYGEPS